jgi:hypothetical protein
VNPDLVVIRQGPFRIRHPLPFGRHSYWPAEYPDLTGAIRELDRVGSRAAEIVGPDGRVVHHSRVWWQRHGKDGRP